MFASIEKALSRSYYPVICRMYARRARSAKSHKETFEVSDRNVRSLEPLEIESMNRKNNQMLDSNDASNVMNVKEFREEFKREIQEFGDVVSEPDTGMFNKTFDSYLDDADRLRKKFKRQKMSRKHFKDLIPREPSLLTWAEKENIRYLMETDPDRWTPETISEAYPISAEGARKLKKSNFRIKTANGVITHDAWIAQYIEKIKSGEIPMTHELEERLKIRELIPLKFGDLGVNAHKIFVRSDPDPNGEFARLVAPPPKKEKAPKTKSVKEAVINKSVTSSELYDPWQRQHQTSMEGKPEMSRRELEEILPRHQLMTFDEFEDNMAHQKERDLSEDMKYMLKLNETRDSPAVPVKLNIVESGDGVCVSNDSFPSKRVQFRKPNETGAIEVSLEGDEAYIYHPDTGVQKPYASKSSKVVERIDIPDEIYRPGATYKFNDCYYDEDGEFLYRVV